MKIIRCVLGVLIIFSVLFTGFYGAGKIAEKGIADTPAEYKGIITMWQIDIFEGGTGSRKQFLLDAARSFEKENDGVLVMVTDYTKTGAEEKFRAGIYPDIVSFGGGVNVDKVGELSCDRYTEGGILGGKIYASAWCRGGYALIANPKYVSGIGDSVDNLIVSSGDYTQPLVALAEEEITAANITLTSPMDAYVAFCAGSAPYLLGTQRDINRLNNRGMEVIVRPLENFNDLYQYAAVTAQDELKRFYAEKFINHLTSDAVQKRLAKIGMMSPYLTVDFENVHMNELQASENRYTLSAFLSETTLNELRSLSEEAVKGNKNALGKIKNMLVSS